MKMNVSSYLLRPHKSSRSTRSNSEYYKVNFILPDELPANHYIGNIPTQIPRFPLTGRTDFSVSTILIDTTGIAQRLLRTSDSGDLYTTSAVDRDNPDQLCGPLQCCRLIICNLTFKVLFVHPHWKQLTVHVNLQLHDTNDNSPSFPQPSFSLWIPERNGLQSTASYTSSSRPSQYYGLPLAADQDSDPNGIVQYRLTGSYQATSTFQLHNNSTSGQLTITVRSGIDLDYETMRDHIFKLTLEAIDGGQPPRTGQMLLVIHLVDVNDNAPTFKKTEDSIHVAENTVYEEPIYTAYATDDDSDDNALIRFVFEPIIPNTPNSLREYFSFHPTTGELHLRKPLDYERYEERRLELKITAYDAGNPPLSGSMKLTIYVHDVNDNPPQLIVQTNQTILENSPPGQLALRLLIRDLDEVSRENVTCSADENQLVPIKLRSLEENRVLVLHTTAVLDYEVNPRLHYGVTCVDAAEPKQIRRFNLTIAVQDINDNAPTFRLPSGLQSPQYNITVGENVALNKLIFLVSADDADSGENGRITYSLFDLESIDEKIRNISTAGFFKIDSKTGGIFVVRRLDYETQKQMSFGVLATDNPKPPEFRQSATAKVVVTVVDVNDNPPILESDGNWKVVEHVPIGTDIGVVKFRDSDSGDEGQVRVDGLLPDINEYDQTKAPVNIRDYFKLTEDGHLVTLRSIDREKYPIFHLRIVARDNGKPFSITATATITVEVIDINDNKPYLVYPEPNSSTTYRPIEIEDRQNVPVYHITEDGKITKNPIYGSELLNSIGPVGGHNVWEFVSPPVINRLQARDADVGQNSQITYELIGTCNGSEHFHLDSSSGMLRARLRLNKTHSSSAIRLKDIQWNPPPGIYLVCVKLLDNGEPPLSSSASFWIKVTESISKAMAKAMWPADSAEYSMISQDQLYFLQTEGKKNHSTTDWFSRVSKSMSADKDLTSWGDIRMSNAVILMLVAVFAITLVSALTAAILWAHSKHRRRRDTVHRGHQRSSALVSKNGHSQELCHVNKEKSVIRTEAAGVGAQAPHLLAEQKHPIKNADGAVSPDLLQKQTCEPLYTGINQKEVGTSAITQDAAESRSADYSSIPMDKTPLDLCDLIPRTECILKGKLTDVVSTSECASSIGVHLQPTSLGEIIVCPIDTSLPSLSNVASLDSNALYASQPSTYATSPNAHMSLAQIPYSDNPDANNADQTAVISASPSSAATTLSVFLIWQLRPD
ncbi:unnamed protein product [Calicophoron daubneyi]|uniref:Cadherin domain-containing protein n=1 Tax=Calicophoron daubneyi TaxID=300641 RepID=A0AAV2TSF1_CALDB